MSAQKTAAVVGAGIGGLAAATALGRADWEVTVYERAEELRPLGAGLSIWPNGVQALRVLGLGELAERASPGGGALRRADGTVLAEFAPDTIAERYGAPLVGLHRADLHDALVMAAGPERVRLGSEVVGVAADGLRLDDGSIVRADVIVGADGIDSTVRAAVIADGAPRDSGIVAFRGVVGFEGEIPAGEWWGEDSIAGLLPLLGSRVYWYLAFRGKPNPAELERRGREYGSPVSEIVAETPAADVLAHRLYDRKPAGGWSSGPTTLLGDAAHPMLPFLGQGACAALEDAVALAEALERNPRVEDALAVYELIRYSRTAQLIGASARAGRIALNGSGLRGRIRDALVARTPATVRLRQLDRVIGRP